MTKTIFSFRKVLRKTNNSKPVNGIKRGDVLDTDYARNRMIMERTLEREFASLFMGILSENNYVHFFDKLKRNLEWDTYTMLTCDVEEYTKKSVLQFYRDFCKKRPNGSDNSIIRDFNAVHIKQDSIFFRKILSKEISKIYGEIDYDQFETIYTTLEQKLKGTFHNLSMTEFEDAVEKVVKDYYNSTSSDSVEESKVVVPTFATVELQPA